ncbi:hypothetical protein V565_130300 [Rhizoctonia solani 123E]|uniref:Zn-finger protein n=1 Tax=Rhizoctonia solani 123E TaxID=1423351 RepID=A0A074RN32_9AGAM|nr:hypothetical protein V565_130300 [Rhizoctonia solani 123E]
MMDENLGSEELNDAPNAFGPFQSDLPARGIPGPKGSNYRILESEDNAPPVSNMAGLRYDARQKIWIEDYPVRTAGMPIRKATQEEIAKYLVGEPGDIGQLSDPDDFEIAEFMLRSGLSVKERERFLNLGKFKQQMPWASDHMMMQDIKKLPHRSKCKPYYYTFEGTKGERTEEAWYRNGLDALREVLSILPLRDDYHFRPEKCYTTPTKENRQYSEAWRAQAMWNTQVNQQATVVQYMIAMDQTPLTGFCGNKKAHPVYFTIGNLPKAIRRTHSHRAVVLLGYLPVPDMDCEPNATKARDIRWKLFNDCIRDMLKPLTDAEREGVEIVCADGNVRRIYPVLSASIADFPEQCKNACIIGSYCPLCLVHKDKKGDWHPNVPLREKTATLQAISEHRREGSANFIDFGLHDQWPWWSRHTYLDIGTMHTPDLLHQLHKGVFKDHLMEWLEQMLGSSTMDSRYQAMPKYHRLRHFKRGISKLSRTTGREAKEMMKVILPAVSDASPQVIEASRALLEFIYLAHSSTLTENELCKMDQQLAKFHQCKGAFVKWLKTERGYHNIAKIHALQHYTHSIRMLGTPDGYNTELPERLHIDLTKAGFRASNKVDGTELEQMTDYIQRMDTLAMHRAYLDFQARLVDFDDESDTESNTEEDPEDFSQGCLVQKVVKNREPVVEINGNNGDQQRADFSLGVDLQAYYPSPNIVTSKQRTECVTVEHLITAHRMPDLRKNIAKFFDGLDNPYPRIDLPSDTKISIWTSARLFHEPLPFKPLEPLKVDKVRAYPAKVDSMKRVRRIAHFDTVLILAYPEKQGIHRYRAARVRAIFELPKKLHEYYPHKLVYVDWFNPFGQSRIQYLDTYGTKLSLDRAQNQQSSVLPLAAVQMTCHLGPRFGTIDKDIQLTRDTDIFDVCNSFMANQFASYHMFELMEHWARTTSE